MQRRLNWLQCRRREVDRSEITTSCTNDNCKTWKGEPSQVKYIAAECSLSKSRGAYLKIPLQQQVSWKCVPIPATIGVEYQVRIISIQQEFNLGLIKVTEQTTQNSYAKQTENWTEIMKWAKSIYRNPTRRRETALNIAWGTWKKRPTTYQTSKGADRVFKKYDATEM